MDEEVEALKSFIIEQSNELEVALTKTGGNVARAARELGIPRTTFINRAKKLGLL